MRSRQRWMRRRSRHRRLSSARAGKRICSVPWTRPFSPRQSARVLLLVALFQQRALFRHGPVRYDFALYNALVRTHETLAHSQISPAGVVAGSSAALGDRRRDLLDAPAPSRRRRTRRQASKRYDLIVYHEKSLLCNNLKIWEIPKLFPNLWETPNSILKFWEAKI